MNRFQKPDFEERQTEILIRLLWLFAILFLFGGIWYLAVSYVTRPNPSLVFQRKMEDIPKGSKLKEVEDYLGIGGEVPKKEYPICWKEMLKIYPSLAGLKLNGKKEMDQEFVKISNMFLITWKRWRDPVNTNKGLIIGFKKEVYDSEDFATVIVKVKIGY